MLKSYLKLAWRNIFRNKLSSIINIVGLSIAIGCSIVIFTFVELNVNKDYFHEKADDIYLVESVIDRNNTQNTWGISPAPLGGELKTGFPQIKEVVRVESDNVIVKYGDHIFEEFIRFVDPAFLEMFTFPLEKGNRSALEDPNAVVISHQMAEKYFVDQNPIGQQLLFIFDDTLQKSFLVKAVAAEFHDRSSFTFRFLLNYEVLEQVEPGFSNNWRQWNTATFVEVENAQDIPAIREAMTPLLAPQNAARPDFRLRDFRFENLLTLSETGDGVRMTISGGQDEDAFKILVVIGVLLLILACFNYMNIAIASASRRLKEIGIRKVVGGQRGQLIFQFLGENLLVCFFALVLGMFWAEFVLLPGFDGAMNQSGEAMTIPYAEGTQLWIFLSLSLLVTALAAGAYPAFYVSSFRPVTILKGNHQLGTRTLFIKILLCVQFMLAFGLIVAGIVFNQNVRYQQAQDWGYNQEGVIVAPIGNAAQYHLMHDAMQQYPHVLSIAPSQGHINGLQYLDAAINKGKDFEIYRYDVGNNYLETMGVRVKEGRTFDEKLATDNLTIVVNETLVSKLEWDDPLSEELMIDSTSYRVIGVVEDFHYRDFFEEIDPVIFKLEDKEAYSYLSIRVAEGHINETFDHVKETWAEMIPNKPFEGYLQNGVFDDFFYVTRGIGKVFAAIAFMALLLASMGLFGLVALNIARRMKEFSIRKVLGATMMDIGKLLNKEFVMLLLISISVSIPVTYFFLNAVLLDTIFSVHIGVKPLPFLLAVIVIAMTAFLTITSQLVKVQKANPADALRDE